jgi:transcription-repair coupling factor (superfamily II helicase)
MDQPDIDPMVIINLIQQAPQTYQFDGKQTFRFNKDMPTAHDRIQQINLLLNQLTAKKAA